MTRAWSVAPVVALVVAAFGVTYGCALFTDLQGFDCGADGCQDAGSDGSASDGSVGPDAPAAIDGGGGDADAGAGRCPEGRGPNMIVAGAFCIDSTETTNAQYEKFLDQAATFDAGPPPPVCAGENGHLPGCGYDPLGKPNSPVRCVSWCDAWTFCKWSGKRLCGRIGGGSLTPFESRDATKSQWMAACTRLGQRAYAYGPTVDYTKCPETGTGSPHDVGAAAGCEGGYPGLFDMNGNLEEWEDSCQTLDGGIFCEKRGNDFQTGAGSCDTSYGEHVSEANLDTGIRCCAD
jgi:formylglycine-generating enzyme